MRTALLALLLATISGALAAGYASQCFQCHMSNEHTSSNAGHMLRCRCPNTSGVFDWTDLHLNTRLNNQNGRLVVDAQGGYRASCERMRLGKDGHVYTASCRFDRDKSAMGTSSIDLDKFVSNQNGKLAFD